MYISDYCVYKDVFHYESETANPAVKCEGGFLNSGGSNSRSLTRPDQGIRCRPHYHCVNWTSTLDALRAFVQIVLSSANRRLMRCLCLANNVAALPVKGKVFCSARKGNATRPLTHYTLCSTLRTHSYSYLLFNLFDIHNFPAINVQEIISRLIIVANS